MIKINEIPVLLYLSFLMLYFTAGDSNNPVWSGLYFISTNIVIGASAFRYRSKIIRNILFSISATMFVYNIVKYIFGYDFERKFTTILLIFCIFGFYKLQNRK